LDGLKVMRGEMLVSMAIAAAMVLIICYFLFGQLMLALMVRPSTRTRAT
jgi:hypothetical protein